jgi:hypothetical protein
VRVAAVAWAQRSSAIRSCDLYLSVTTLPGMPPITLRVTFGSEHPARGLWRELRERDYHPELFVRPDDTWFVVVTTDAWLRAEVAGLGWMAGGSVTEVKDVREAHGSRLIG